MNRGSLRAELLRAAGGALLVGLPLLMTQEMWQAGYSIPLGRLALFLGLNYLLLVGLSYFVGFEPSKGLLRAPVEAMIALGIGFVMSTAVLALFDLFGPEENTLATHLRQVLLLSIPTSIGAIVARSQFGGRPRDEEEKEERAGLAGRIFMGIAGAIFFAFNIAPTDEVIEIATGLSLANTVLAVLGSLALIYGFVYGAEFRGGHERPESHVVSWVRFPLIGYAIALLTSAYVLWTFGRFDTQLVALNGVQLYVKASVVLGVPSALGVAVGNLIL